MIVSRHLLFVLIPLFGGNRVFVYGQGLKTNADGHATITKEVVELFDWSKGNIAGSIITADASSTVMTLDCVQDSGAECDGLFWPRGKPGDENESTVISLFLGPSGSYTLDLTISTQGLETIRADEGAPVWVTDKLTVTHTISIAGGFTCTPVPTSSSDKSEDDDGNQYHGDIGPADCHNTATTSEVRVNSQGSTIYDWDYTSEASSHLPRTLAPITITAGFANIGSDASVGANNAVPSTKAGGAAAMPMNTGASGNFLVFAGSLFGVVMLEAVGELLG